MSKLKQLASQTAIYGISSIVGRLLNYLLVPLHTYFFDPDAYGEVGDIYAYIAFLMVFLTFGMETAFFRFTQTEDKGKVFSSAAGSVLIINVIFLVLVLFNSQNLADIMLHPQHPEYIMWLGVIVFADAVAAIPMAKLRAENRAKRFVAVNLTSIGINITLNAFFIGVCMNLQVNGKEFMGLEKLYDPAIGVGYVFIANVVASMAKPLMLWREYLKINMSVDRALLMRMLIYASPIMIAGFAGIINETLDRILIRRVREPIVGLEMAKFEEGVYTACYKLSIAITITIQAFRYAAEPFFFAQSKEEGHQQTYAKVMNYFVAVLCLIFIGVTLMIGLAKYFIPNPDYWEGLKIVPILLLANIFLGIYYNQSIWYKVADKTLYGAYIALAGAAVTLVINFVFLPKIGYMASAWATLAAYSSMCVWSYILGRKYYPIPYQLGHVFLYIGLSVGLFFLCGKDMLLWSDSILIQAIYTVLGVGALLALVWWLEKPGALIRRSR